MRVIVARGASGELESGVPRRTARLDRLVTFGASDFRMQAGQRIPRVGVIEAADVFPVRSVVAALAVFAELALVKILVTGEASRREPEECFVQTLLFDQRPHLWIDTGCRVTLPAFQTCVLAFERVAGLLMIEGFL